MEYKAENRLSQGSSVVLTTGALGHEGEGAVRADRPVFAVLKLVERAARHEQDDLAVMSDAEREAERGRCDTVVVDRLAVDPQHALAELARHPCTALGHTPKDQHARCLVSQLLVLGIEAIEARNGPIGARVNLRLGTGKRWNARNQSEQCQAGDSHRGFQFHSGSYGKTKACEDALRLCVANRQRER